MTPEQFCYWLQGFVELSGDIPPTAEQWKSIREHIQTVFKKVTPPVLGPAFAGFPPPPVEVDARKHWPWPHERNYTLEDIAKNKLAITC